MLYDFSPFIIRVRYDGRDDFMQRLIGGISTLQISLVLRPREISWVSGNLLVVGDGFPNTSLVLVEQGFNALQWTNEQSRARNKMRRDPRELTICDFRTKLRQKVQSQCKSIKTFFAMYNLKKKRKKFNATIILVISPCSNI